VNSLQKALFLLSLAPLVLAATPPSLESRVVEKKLANGITLLIMERHYSPTVSVRMMFRTGSVDEVNGKTGLAHMFEHMMFKGTRTIGTRNYAQEAPLLKRIDELHLQIDKEKEKRDKADQNKIADLLEELRTVQTKANALVVPNELWQIYEREGGSALNASTSRDLTRYTVDLPSNKLALWAVLDSDRLRRPVFREFYAEREVVKEERRMRVDTDPDGLLIENFLATAYLAHPYRMPTIGWESDLDHLHMADLDDFYRRFYTPDQLTIAVVGDVKTSDVIALVEKNFGDWQTPSVPPNHITEEPPATGPRQVTVRFEAEPQLIISYPLPNYPERDHFLSDGLENLLVGGMTARLNRTLVQRKKLATGISIYTNYPGNRYAPLFMIFATPRHPTTNAQLKSAIESELEKVKKDPIADWELEKVRSSVEMAVLSTLQNNGGLADTLASFQTLYGDWRYLTRYQKEINAMTAADLQAAARRIFIPAKQVAGFLEKK